MFPVTSRPIRYFGLTACSSLKLSQINIDSFSIFTAEFWIHSVFCIHITHCKNYIQESLTQIFLCRGTARCFHGAWRRSIDLETERLFEIIAKRSILSENGLIIGINSRDYLPDRHAVYFHLLKSIRLQEVSNMTSEMPT